MNNDDMSNREGSSTPMNTSHPYSEADDHDVDHLPQESEYYELEQELKQLENALDLEDDDALFAMLDEIHGRNVEELEQFDETGKDSYVVTPTRPSERQFKDDLDTRIPTFTTEVATIPEDQELDLDLDLAAGSMTGLPLDESKTPSSKKEEPKVEGPNEVDQRKDDLSEMELDMHSAVPDDMVFERKGDKKKGERVSPKRKGKKLGFSGLFAAFKGVKSISSRRKKVSKSKPSSSADDAIEDAEKGAMESDSSEAEEKVGGPMYNRTVVEPEYEDDEEYRTAKYEQYDRPEPPDDQFALRHIERPPPPPLDDDPYSLEHYTPDGGVVEHEHTREWSYESDGGYVPETRPEQEKTEDALLYTPLDLDDADVISSRQEPRGPGGMPAPSSSTAFVSHHDDEFEIPRRLRVAPTQQRESTAGSPPPPPPPAGPPQPIPPQGQGGRTMSQDLKSPEQANLGAAATYSRTAEVAEYEDEDEDRTRKDERIGLAHIEKPLPLLEEDEPYGLEHYTPDGVVSQFEVDGDYATGTRAEEKKGDLALKPPAAPVVSDEQKRAQEMSSALDWLRGVDSVDDESEIEEEEPANSRSTAGPPPPPPPAGPPQPIPPTSRTQEISNALDWLPSADPGLRRDDEKPATEPFMKIEALPPEGRSVDLTSAGLLGSGLEAKRKKKSKKTEKEDKRRNKDSKKLDKKEKKDKTVKSDSESDDAIEAKQGNKKSKKTTTKRDKAIKTVVPSDSESDDAIEAQVPEEIAIILETAAREASNKSKLRTETLQFLDTLHSYLVCRRKMDAKYAEIDEFQIIAKHVVQADGSNMRASKTDPLLYNAQYQQQSVHGRAVETLSELYEAAEKTKPIYQDIVMKVVRQLQSKYSESIIGMAINLCDLKGKQRAQEKAEDDYAKRRPKPGLSWLYDIVRGSVEFTSAQHVIEFLNLIQQEPSIRIVKAKNRFTEPSLTGYRDLNIQFQVDTKQGFYHTCELQIHHKAIKELDEELHTHMYYEFFRSYFAGATSSLKERLEVLKLISDGGAIDDSFLSELLPRSNDVERLERLGVLFRDQLCEYQWAFRVFVRLFDIRKGQYGSRHPEVGRCYNDMALILKEQGKLDEAMELYQESLEIHMAAYDDQHAELAKMYFAMALVLKEQEKLSESMEMFEKSLMIDIKCNGEDSFSVANTYNHMAAILRKEGKLDEAMNLFQKSLDSKRRLLGEVDSSIADTLQNIGIILRQKGELDHSAYFLQESIDIATKSMGENHTSVAVGYRNLALVLEKQGLLSKALELYGKSLDIYRKNVGEKHLLVADIYNDMAYSHKLQGDKGKAKGLLVKSLNIKKKLFAERVIEAGLRKKIANQRRDASERRGSYIGPHTKRIATV